MTRSITIEHDGQTYYGHIATITSTMLGYEDHGILTSGLTLAWESNGIVFGGYCLDESAGQPNYDRVGTAYGLDHLIRTMETVGVSKWEDLKGRQVIVLFPAAESWGLSAVGIASLTDTKRVFIPAAHAQAWRDAEAAAVTA